MTVSGTFNASPTLAGMSRRVQAVGRALSLAIVLIPAIAASSAESSSGADHKVRKCGHTRLYGHALTIKVRGEPLPCDKVHRIIRGRCDPDGEPWFCFSFWVPGPPLAWIRSEERFQRELSTLITASRYPCGQIGDIAEEWRGRSKGFPTRKQIVADDLIRCNALKGMSIDEVEALLGEPAYSSASDGNRFRGYVIGLQRDSFFQLDSEVLSLRFSRRGNFREASIYRS